MSDLVVVCSCPDLGMAKLYQSILSGEGIESSIDGEHTASLNLPLIGGLSEISLRVWEEDLERARRAIEDIGAEGSVVGCSTDSRPLDGNKLFVAIQPLPDKEEPPDPDERICASCGSDLVYRRPFAGWQLAFGALCLFLPFLFWRQPWICKECGAPWTG
jgi:hypothetical protein